MPKVIKLEKERPSSSEIWLREFAVVKAAKAELTEARQVMGMMSKWNGRGQGQGDRVWWGLWPTRELYPA